MQNRYTHILYELGIPNDAIFIEGVGCHNYSSAKIFLTTYIKKTNLSIKDRQYFIIWTNTSKAHEVHYYIFMYINTSDIEDSLTDIDETIPLTVRIILDYQIIFCLYIWCDIWYHYLGFNRYYPASLSFATLYRDQDFDIVKLLKIKNQHHKISLKQLC